MKEKIILWGMGKIADDFFKEIKLFEEEIKVIAVTDSNQQKWGTEIGGFIVISPQEACVLKFDKIIVTSTMYFDEIKNRILQDTEIKESFIENIYYFAKKKILNRYKTETNQEIQTILSYLENESLDVFNYEFKKNYSLDEINPIYDNGVNLFYVMHNGHKLYMASNINTEDKVKRYYNSIRIEQDELSPHQYLTKEFGIVEGDVVVDVGAAEGNFALDVIEKAKKVYIIETNEQWIEALKNTFHNYLDKIVMINKFAADYTAGREAKIDDMISEPVNFIKLDIEGCELAALNGLHKTIESAEHIKIAACTYHNDNDAEMIKNVLEKTYGMDSHYSRGYMYYPYSIQQKFILPSLRRGIIRGCK